MRGVVRAGVAAALVAGLVTGPLAAPASADETRDKQWVLDALDIAKAHRTSEGDNVTIALVDSGVDATHPDLKGNVLKGKTMWDGRGDGRKDTIGHGTSMASDMVAHGHGRNHEDGALGIAPRAKVLPVSVFPPAYLKDPNCCDDDVYKGTSKGVRWAADHGADVIVVPSGGSCNDKKLEAAVEYAIKTKNVPVVAAAGNREKEALGNKTSVESPACFDDVIAVNGTGRDGKLWKGAIAPKGPSDGSVTVAAPAEDSVTAKLGGGYDTASGTSDSAAIVGGVVALMRARWAHIGWKDLDWRLTETTDGTTDGKGYQKYDQKLGYGIVNPVKALTAHVKPPKGVADDHINPKPDPKTAPNPTVPEADKSSSKDKRALVGSDATSPWLLVAGGIVALAIVAGLVALGLRRRRTARPAASLPQDDGRPAHNG